MAFPMVLWTGTWWIRCIRIESDCSGIGPFPIFALILPTISVVLVPGVFSGCNFRRGLSIVLVWTGTNFPVGKLQWVGSFFVRGNLVFHITNNHFSIEQISSSSSWTHFCIASSCSPNHDQLFWCKELRWALVRTWGWHAVLVCLQTYWLQSYWVLLVASCGWISRLHWGIG